VAVSMQNGAGNLEPCVAVCRPRNVLCAITSHGATNLGPGHVRHGGYGDTTVAPLRPSGMDNVQRVVGLLCGAGIDAVPAAVADDVIWSKLVINAAINPLTAAEDVMNGALLTDDRLRSIMRSAALEAAAAAAGEGVTLLYDDPVATVEQVCRRTAGNISSMLQDVRHGRNTEIDAITGAVVASGRSHGVPVPTNEMLWERVKTIARSRR